MRLAAAGFCPVYHNEPDRFVCRLWRMNQSKYYPRPKQLDIDYQRLARIACQALQYFRTSSSVSFDTKIPKLKICTAALIVSSDSFGFH